LQFISVQGEPCGFLLPDHPDNTPEDAALRFGTRTSTYSLNSYRTGTTTVGFVEVPYQDEAEVTRTYTETIGLEGGVCEEGDPTSSDVEYYYELTTLEDGRKWPEITTNRSSGFAGGLPCSGSVTTSTTFESDPPDSGDTVTTTDEDNFCYASPLGVGSDWTKTGNSYSKTIINPADEPFEGETTETETVAFSDPVVDVLYPDWPAWPGESEEDYTTGQGNSNIAEKAADYQVKIKWRFRHTPTGTCYFKAWVRKTFTPAPTDPPADPLPEPTVTEESYEWIGAGNPCIADPTKAFDHEENLIVGDEIEVLPPEEPGQIFVELIKFSCVEGYEPDITDEDNPQPNGFPDPTWEAAPP
jgi:hypothetical protein